MVVKLDLLQYGRTVRCINPTQAATGKLNFVPWHLIFVGPCCGTCFSVTRLASRVFRWLPGFWKNLCSPDSDEGCLENGVLEKIFWTEEQAMEG